jgi:hypothetical protein
VYFCWIPFLSSHGLVLNICLVKKKKFCPPNSHSAFFWTEVKPGLPTDEYLRSVLEKGYFKIKSSLSLLPDAPDP